MIVEIIVAILTKVGESVVSPIGRRFRYLHHYDKNVQELQKQVAKLAEARDGVLQLVKVAGKKGEEIKTDVKKWLKDVDEIIAKAQGLDAKIKLNKLHSRLKLSKEAWKKSVAISELRIHANAPTNMSLPAAPPPSIDFISNEDFVMVESGKSAMDEILEGLQDDKCEVIGVYGMGGIGKTTLVKEVGRIAKESNLFDIVLVAVVSQTPNVRKIQGQLADVLGLQLVEESESGRANRLYMWLKNEERVLTILDDVWSKIDLAAIGIPRGADHKGCKIIITTRRENVCSVMGHKTKSIPMNLLSIDESWCLFKENVGQIVDSPVLRGVAEKVAKECRGLPLALVTVGRALQDKEIGEWNIALNHLKKAIATDIEVEEHDLFSCIKLSYDYLESEEKKSSLLFCCLFPEDYDIKVEDLARFGMGKGLFKDVDTMEEARTRAHVISKYLKASCLLLESDKEWCVKVHDVVRDVVITIMIRENATFLVRSGFGLKEWPNVQTFEQYTDISLMANDIHKLPSNIKCPKLQVLLLGENEGFDEIPNGFFMGMPLLRVLDLSERIGFRSLLPSFPLPPRILTLPSSFEFLAQLRTLHFDNCKLGDISVLGKVRTLEILSFYGSDIKELPKEIGKLVNLRVLDLSYCQYLQFIPSNLISQLSQLEELYMGGSFRELAIEELGEETTKACLSELKSLSRLVILCVELSCMSCFPTNLYLNNLLKFEVSIGCPSVQCYPKSRSLNLREIKTPLSDEVKALFKNAEEASLFCLIERSMNDVDPSGSNGLKSLVVSACNEMKYLLNSTDQLPVVFADLEELHVKHMHYLDFIFARSLPPPSLHKLRVLKVEFCPELFFGFFHFSFILLLQNLEELVIRSCKRLMRVFQLPKVYDNEHVLFSTLTKLTLAHLSDLRLIWGMGSSQLVINLNNLKAVNITSCGLNYVFPFPVAQSLVKLETLVIQWCKGIERVVDEDKAGDIIDHSQPFSFPSLKVVHIEGCMFEYTNIILLYLVSLFH